MQLGDRYLIVFLLRAGALAVRARSHLVPAGRERWRGEKERRRDGGRERRRRERRQRERRDGERERRDGGRGETEREERQRERRDGKMEGDEMERRGEIEGEER